MAGKSAMKIIGGSDGPTSIFVLGQKEKNVFRRVRNALRKKKYQRRRARVLAKLEAKPHSLDEVCEYLVQKHGAEELESSAQEYQNRFREVKASLVQKYQPKLLGNPLEEYRPSDFTNQEEVYAFMEKCREYQQKAESLPQEQFPMDFHCFLIKSDGGKMHIEIEKLHAFMSVGYEADKGKKKHFDQICKDIYWYYGVTKEDIASKSERLKSLLAVFTA